MARERGAGTARGVNSRPRPRTPKKKTAYHHEDLRRALLDAAIVYLRKGDVTGLTMQSLARAAGVSPGAPYHHFEDKVSVIAELATEGFALWLKTARDALARSDDPRTQLEALARAWLAFTAAHPSHYRIMFLRDVEDRKRFAKLHATSGEGLALLAGVLHRCLPGEAMNVVLARAVAAWSTLHGFASLRNDGVFANRPELPPLTDLENEAVGRVLSGALA